jgi:hypothetical protein
MSVARSISPTRRHRRRANRPFLRLYTWKETSFGYRAAGKGVLPWIQDGMRHTFCSNWLAITPNADELVLLSGHRDKQTMWVCLRRGRVYTLHITQIRQGKEVCLTETDFRSEPDDAEIRLGRGAIFRLRHHVLRIVLYRRDPFPGETPFLEIRIEQRQMQK